MQPKGNRRSVAHAIVADVVNVADVADVVNVATDYMKLCSCSELKRILLGFLADFSPGFEAGST